ncbi:MAG TPA: hypothetical protein VHV57_14710 [Acidimicrobiales bacterium]|jgi:hypothetical protein|nr:hypothetical protein [Acidimicrobiales bacterium]
MPETAIAGVSLFSKERGKNIDVFELALTYDGIEIRRPAEDPRFLSWERITEWEIEQRRGGVLLILRGGGSVTPLTIPRWKVDDLDLVLRDVTTHWSRNVAEQAGAGAGLDEGRRDEADALAHEFESAPEPAPRPPVAPATPAAPLPLPLPQVDTDLDWSPVEPHKSEQGGAMDAGIPPADDQDSTVAGTLVWPDRSTLTAVPDLAWPSDTPPREEPADPALSWDAESTPKPKVRVLESTPEPVPVMRAAEPKVVIRPVEGAPDRPAPVTARATRAARRTRMHTNQSTRRKSPAQLAFTISLLGAIAVSVSLILAQSAGAVHLSFLGFAG